MVGERTRSGRDTAAAIVDVRGLTKRYGRVAALQDVSFTVPAGAVTGFLGANGSGKTTTLRILLGLVAPTSGSALIHGRPYREMSDPARTVGAVLEPTAHPARTGLDHLRCLALALGLPRRSRRHAVDEVLGTVELTAAADRPVGTYSLGMRGRLAIACALLGDPELLVLDEPANGLDPEGIRWLRRFLRGWAAQGRSALVSSHVLAEVAQTVDHVVIIERGRVVLAAEAAAVGAGRVEVRTPQADQLAELLGGAGAVRTGHDSLRLPYGWAERVGQLCALHGIPLVELHTTGPDLERAFFELTGRAAGGAA
ncbi:ABC transporter ATP-binding protein [Parafrankia sp. EUN1f]|uniref:ABC transporter ATP-binding protein n=1 Tax=Parafrankia sp. EUN1f TaxID=102897 RepID=UPI0001C45EDB|nr:ABC transporter related protein [Parafrankia sp. EUN1f]